MKINFSEKNQYGKLIRQLRKAEGLTQVELAKRIGTTPQNLGQYERGVRTPKPETLNQILSELGYFLVMKAKKMEEQ